MYIHIYIDVPESICTFGAIRSKDRSYFDRSKLSTLSKLKAKYLTQVSPQVQYFSVFNYWFFLSISEIKDETERLD